MVKYMYTDSDHIASVLRTAQPVKAVAVSVVPNISEADNYGPAWLDYAVEHK